MSEYIKYAVLGLDVIVIVALIGYVFIGVGRGFRSNLRHMLSFMVPFIVFICFINLICKWVLHFPFPFIAHETGFLTAHKWLVDWLSTQLYNGATIDTSSEMFILIESLAVTVVRLGVYIAGIFLIAILIAPLIRFVMWLIRKIIGMKNGKKGIFSRIGGMGIGLLRFAIFFIVIMLPIYGTFGLADTVISDQKWLEEKFNPEPHQTIAEIDDVTLENIQQAIQSSFVYKTLALTNNQATGMSAAAHYLGTLLQVNTNNGKVNLVTEYGKISKVMPIILQHASITTDASGKALITFTLSDLTEVEITTIVNTFQQSELLTTMIPIAVEYGVEKLKAQGFEEKYGINLSSIENMNWKTEIPQVFMVVQAIGMAMVEAKVDITNPNEILDITNLPVLVDNIVQQVIKLQLVSQVAMPVIVEKIKESLETLNKPELQELIDVITPEMLFQCMSKDMKLGTQIVQSVYQMDLWALIKGEDVNIDFSDEAFCKQLGDTVVQLFQLSVMKGLEEVVVKTLLSLPNFVQHIDFEQIFTEVTVNWQEEPQLLADAFSAFLSMMTKESELNIEMFLEDMDRTEILVEKLSASQLLRYIMITILEAESSSSIPEDLNSMLDFERLKSFDKVAFAEEINNLFYVMKDLKTVNILFGDEHVAPDLQNQVVIRDMMNRLFHSCFVRGNEQQVVDYLLKTFDILPLLEQYNIALTTENIDWQNEPSRLADIIVAFGAFENFAQFDFGACLQNRKEEQINQLATLMDAFTASDIFAPITFQILAVMTASAGYEMVFAVEEQMLIHQNTWQTEFNILFSIMDRVSEQFSEDVVYTQIHGADVTSLMLLASEGVVSAKLTGSVLKRILGSAGLNIEPVDENGQPQYDFTKQAVLAENATTIGTLIDMTNQLNDIDLSEPNSVNALVNTIEKLSDSPLVKDIVTHILPDATIDFSNLNFKTEAQTVQAVYEVYQQAPNPTDFDIHAYPELAQKVEDTPLAKAILKYIGIIN